MPARKGNKGRRGPNQQLHDAAEQLVTMERELNALRFDLQGRPVEEIRAYLSGRYGADLEKAGLNDCVAAIAAGREVRLRQAGPPRADPRPRRGF